MLLGKVKDANLDPQEIASLLSKLVFDMLDL